MKRLPEPLEFLVVTGIAFGLPVVVSLRTLARAPTPSPVESTTSGTALTLAFELVSLALVFLFLRARDWPLRALAPRVTGRATIIGVSLFLWAYVVYFLLYFAFDFIVGFAPGGTGLPKLRLSPIVGAFVLVNPVFEETLVNAYVQNALRRHGGAAAVATSTVLRLSYHLYQGWVAVPSVVACGVVLGGYYWFRRDLWPPIVAHFLADAVPLILSR